MSDRYLFQLSPYDGEALLPQVRRALQERTEMLARERYPGLWRITDRLPKGSKPRRGNKVFSLLFLAVGLFLVIPGLIAPRELLLPLIAGVLSLCRGIIGLLPRRDPQQQFDRSARQLLAEKAVTDRPVTVVFDEEGMELPEERAAYGDFETVMETDDLLLLVFGEKIVLLQKKDLAEGEIAALCRLLQTKTTRFRKL